MKKDANIGIDNLSVRKTNLVVDPTALFQKALENLNDAGAFPGLYKDVIDNLIDYAEQTEEAEDPDVLEDKDLQKRRIDFVRYLVVIWGINTDKEEI